MWMITIIPTTFDVDSANLWLFLLVGLLAGGLPPTSCRSRWRPAGRSPGRGSGLASWQLARRYGRHPGRGGRASAAGDRLRGAAILLLIVPAVSGGLAQRRSRRRVFRQSDRPAAQTADLPWLHTVAGSSTRPLPGRPEAGLKRGRTGLRPDLRRRSWYWWPGPRRSDPWCAEGCLDTEDTVPAAGVRDRIPLDGLLLIAFKMAFAREVKPVGEGTVS